MYDNSKKKLCEEIMPLTKEGQKILKQFQSRYGKEKGKEIFFATINKDNEKTKSWHLA